MRQTTVAVGRRLRRLVYTQERLIIAACKLDSIVVPWQQGELRIDDLRPEHLPALSQLNRRRGSPEVDRRFSAYVAAGFPGFVAYDGDDLIGYYWWVDRTTGGRFPDLRQLELGIELGDGDVYGSDFFLLDEYRGGGTAAEFLYKVESALRDRGYKRLWGYIASDNRPARWLYSTRGYIPMWAVCRKRILIVNRTTRESA